MSQKSYDPTLYTIVVAAIPIDKGYADGEFIKVAYENASFGDVAGTDGSVTRFKIKDKRATVTLTLMQGADANAILSALLLADENSDNGAGVGPFLLKDRNGTTVYAGDSCWIQKGPDPTLDKNPTERAWEIRVANLERFEGAL